MSGSFNGPPVGRRPRWPFSALQRTPGSNIATVVRPSGRQAFDRRDLIPPPRGPAQHTNGFAELHQPRSFHELPVDPQKLQDFDCPIRAGPNDGELRCTWRSTRDGGYGFSLLSRMRYVPSILNSDHTECDVENTLEDMASYVWTAARSLLFRQTSRIIAS